MSAARALAAALALLAAPAAAQVPRFVEETAGSGIAHVYAGDWEYMVGGGVAVFDCDGDARPDLVIAGGEGPLGLYRNQSETGGPLRFAAAEAPALTGVTGAYPLDIDSDGVMDVVLLRLGENVLLRGLPGCRFARANEDWGFDGGDAWSAAFAATWEKGQDWPTLAIGNYIDRQEEAFPWGSCTDNWLHRPAPDGGGFAPPLPLRPSFCALSMLFTDWNGSGRAALRISNDREYYKGGQEQLWRVDPGLPPQPFGPQDGWRPLRIWGMGIAASDLDADGYPEYFLTSMADNKLQRLALPQDGTPPAPVYDDRAHAMGVTAHQPYTGGEIRPSTAWHAQFEDVNNDGLADLFVAKGNVAEMPDFAIRDPNNLLVQNPDGTFTERGEEAGVASMANARGGALADLNGDGLLDLVAVNRWEAAQLWRNVTPGAGAWIGLRLRQDGANPDAIGARIELRPAGGGAPMRREVTSGGGHAGGVSLPHHFGLGMAEGAALRVTWPDGAVSDREGLEAGRVHDVRR